MFFFNLNLKENNTITMKIKESIALNSTEGAYYRNNVISGAITRNSVY